MFSGKKVLLVSGGTFGHLYPALIMSKYYDLDLYASDNCKKFFESINSKVQFFEFTRTFNPFKIIKKAYYFWKIMKNYDVLITFGGYICLPAVIASLFKNIECYFHEQNANLSLVNKIAYYLRFTPLLSFKNTIGMHSFSYFKKSILYGYPTEGIAGIGNNINNKKSILVFAGSGGSDFFDEKIAPMVAKFARENGYKVYFAAKNIEKVKQYFSSGDEIKSFFFNINEILSGVNFVIGRSGAGTISKIFLTKKPAILVPLSTSTRNHQLLNAKNSGIDFIEEKHIESLENKLYNLSKFDMNDNFILKIF